MGLESSDHDQAAEMLVTSFDAPQLSHVHPDEDPIRSDIMSRMIEISPPTQDLGRISPLHRAYA
jgi:hypothetical protein